MADTLIAVGRIEHLCLNGEEVNFIDFRFTGPTGDKHSGMTRKLSGHDGDYLKSSELQRGEEVFNWRSWTALSAEEVSDVESLIRHDIPPGTLFENMVISGVPNFSTLPPTSRFVFRRSATQPILAVWEENGPCKTVGERLARLHEKPDLTKDFIKYAQGRRGVMGFVLSPGRVVIGESVKIYGPVR
jgi:hypothetical protein